MIVMLRAFEKGIFELDLIRDLAFLLHAHLN